MIRQVDIIRFVNGSKSSWYNARHLEINLNKRHYKKGDIVIIHKKKYFVVEDYGALRVTPFTGAINPFQSLIKQFSQKSK
ncbi:MAG: hypothetical protein ACE3JK_02815 [Sporolactobacillus sp.]